MRCGRMDVDVLDVYRPQNRRIWMARGMNVSFIPTYPYLLHTHELHDDIVVSMDA